MIPQSQATPTHHRDVMPSLWLQTNGSPVSSALGDFRETLKPGRQRFTSYPITRGQPCWEGLLEDRPQGSSVIEICRPVIANDNMHVP